MRFQRPIHPKTHDPVPGVAGAVVLLRPQRLVLRFRNNARVFETISPAKTTRSPSPNWRGNCGAQHLVALGSDGARSRGRFRRILRLRRSSMIEAFKYSPYGQRSPMLFSNAIPRRPCVREPLGTLTSAVRRLLHRQKAATDTAHARAPHAPPTREGRRLAMKGRQGGRRLGTLRADI